LCLENSGMKIYDLVLGPPNNQVRMTDYLEDAIRRFQGMQEEHREVVIELKALQSFVAQD
jgi:hypothetical protein